MNRWKGRFAALLLALVLCLGLAPGALAASDYDRPGQKLAALTFDDGPCKDTAAILDTLKAHGAKATFFMNGFNVVEYADQVRRMVQEGHQIANHTYDHPDLVQCSPDKARNEIHLMNKALTEATGLTGTGETSFYVRPPFGSRNEQVLSLAGAPVVCWTVDSSDWQYKDPDHLVNYVTANTRDGDIILAHETVPTTAQGLDRLLTQLEAKGFQLVTVEDLFWRRGIEPQAGNLYFSAPNTGVNRCPKELYFDESKLSSHWAYGAIAYVKAHGLMAGNAYGEFTPNFPLTRGMFVTVLGRLSGVKGGAAASGFGDIPDGSYVAPYAAWAKANGIMEGVDAHTFGADRPLTRQEMAVALARYVRFRGAFFRISDQDFYRDEATIATWAREGVAICATLGLLQGSNGIFDPQATTTRAMGAEILQRLDQFTFPSWREKPRFQADLWSLFCPQTTWLF